MHAGEEGFKMSRKGSVYRKRPWNRLTRFHLTLMLWVNSADKSFFFFFFFFFFSKKLDLTLHANCLLRRQFACNAKFYFLEKLCLLNFLNIQYNRWYQEQTTKLTLSCLSGITKTLCLRFIFFVKSSSDIFSFYSVLKL